MAQKLIDEEKIDPFCMRSKTIATKEAIQLLQNDEGASTYMPIRPKGGEVYLFKGDRITSNDYKTDGHIW